MKLLKTVTLKIKGEKMPAHSIHIYTGLEGPYCEIELPKRPDFPIDSPATISLADSIEPIFTGFVTAIYKQNRRCRLMLETSRHLLDKTLAVNSWRKISLTHLLKEILDEVEVTDFNLVKTDIEIPRFSWQKMGAVAVLQKLIYTLTVSYGRPGYIYYFDNLNRFHFGPAEDLRQDRGIKIERLISREKRRLEAVAAPIFFNDRLTVEGQPEICLTSHFELTPDKYRVNFTIKRSSGV